MRRITRVAIALLGGIACCAAAGPLRAGQQRAGAPELKRLTPEQLTACYNDATICGTSDAAVISAELARRLPELSAAQLVACFDNQHLCGVAEASAPQWPISDELARRGNPASLFDLYWHEDKPAIRAGIEHVAYHFDTPQTEAFMRQVFAGHENDGEDLYYPANYLAKRCDPAALKLLGTGRYRDQGCEQYQGTVELFGRCKYRAAIPYLIDTALQDTCGNVGEAAAKDLEKFYPQSKHRSFDNLDDMQAFYCGEAKKEGLTVSCSIEPGK